MQHDGDGLVGLACALGGDSATAARLLAEVQVHAPAVPAGQSEDDTATGTARARLVQRALRLPPSDGEPVRDPELPERVRALQGDIARLAPLPRTVLVLRHREHLTLLEIAQLTERSPAAVGRALEVATTAVPAEPYLVEQALAALPPPDPGQRQAALAQVRRRRGRTRSRLVLAGALVGALVAAAVLLPGLLQPDPYTRAGGEWLYSITLPEDVAFDVTGRSMTPTEEVMVVRRTGASAADCTVTVTTTELETPVPEGRATKVGTRPARWVEDDELWWSLGLRTSAVADCDEPVADTLLLELAALVRTGPEPLLLPFTLPALPEDQEVSRVYDYERFHGAILIPRGEDEESPDSVIVAIPTFFPMPQDRRPRTVDINGTSGTVIRESEGQWVCWPVGGETACVGSVNQAQRPPDPTRQVGRLTAVARSVRVAPDLTDRGSWFDGRVALPR